MNEKTNNEKKTSKAKTKTESEEFNAAMITSKTDLKNFLLSIKDKLGVRSAPPIHAVTAMQHVFNLPGIYDLLDKSNRELAREVWIKLKHSGLQLKNPPLLFSAEEVIAEQPN